MKLSPNKESEDNIIDSARVVEDFAFKYASFNLNSSRNQERRENQHIGKTLKSPRLKLFQNCWVVITYVTRSRPFWSRKTSIIHLE